MRKTNREKLADAKRKSGTQAQSELTLDQMLAQMLGGAPNPTQQRFIYSPGTSLAYMGPAGVAKTSSIAARGLLRTLFHPGYKLLVARHDYNDLLGTTAQRMEEMVNRLPKGVLVDRNKSAPMRWWLRPIVSSGADEDVSEITFMGLKEGLGSYDWHAAIIDEADEVEQAGLNQVRTRLRTTHGGYDNWLAACFNPPDKLHYLYKECTGLNEFDKKVQEPTFELFIPQLGENSHNLPAGYHENLSKTLTADEIDRLVKGNWGTSFAGEPVYKQFNKKWHVRRGLKFDPDGGPLIFGWDFGYRHPFVIWMQFDSRGRLLVLASHMGENIEAPQFARFVKQKTLELFGPASRPHAKLHFGDPAVVQKKDTGQTLKLLRDEGITILYQTSTIEEGTRRCRLLFERVIEGEPAVLFDEMQNQTLIRGLGGGYRLDKSGQKAIKDGVYDHGADAFRYAIFNMFGADAEVTNPHEVGAEGDGDSFARTSTIPDSLEYDPEDDR